MSQTAFSFETESPGPRAFSRTRKQIIKDVAEGSRRRDVAIRRVGEAAPDSFLTSAMVAIRRLARTGATFTTDDVWATIPTDRKPSEPRAMGAVMRLAQREGIIDPTPDYRESVRPECHRNPKRVWTAKVTA